MDSQTILNQLAHYSGSETFHRDPFILRNMVYTDGFKTFLELCSCEWLYSDIAVILRSKFLNKEDFVLCKIQKEKDPNNTTNKNYFVVYLYSDYNKEDPAFNKEHLLYKQKYSYSDFPLNEYEFYAVFNELGSFTFMLKSEY